MKTDYPVTESPTIDIVIPDEYLKGKEESARLLTIQECLYYINGISCALKVMGNEGATFSEASYNNAIECLGSLNNSFCSIAWHNLDMYFMEQSKKGGQEK